MIDNYNKFINGEVFTKKDVQKILLENKIDEQIIDIKFYQFKKIYIKTLENNKYYLLKLCLNEYSIALANNEESGYLYFSKTYNSRFNLPTYKKINTNINYSLSKVEFIKGNRGNYFEFDQFYNTEFSKKFKTIRLEDYVNLIKKKFCKNINNQKRSIKLTKIIDIFLSKYQSNLIPIGPSHGDFTNFNTLKTSDKKRYVFDLEFFQELRPFLYDYFHWHIGPLLYNIMKYGITIKLNNNILYILIKIFNFKFKNYFNKSTIKNKKLFELLLAIYLLERYMFFEFQIHLNNIDELISQKEKTFNKNNADLILSLITKLIK